MSKGVKIIFDFYDHEGNWLESQFSHADVPPGETWKFRVKTGLVPLTVNADVGEIKFKEITVR